jgi:ABC-type phosphate transport system substrate-binding protein
VARSAIIVGSLLLAVAWLGLASSSTASSDDFKVIAHPGIVQNVVDREFLRDAFLGKATRWRQGTVVRPMDLSWRLQVRDHFTLAVLKKSPAQIRNYWIQQIFSGTGLPPPEADSAQAAIAYVRSTPGAVSYVPIDVDPGGAKVVQIR